MLAAHLSPTGVWLWLQMGDNWGNQGTAQPFSLAPRVCEERPARHLRRLRSCPEAGGLGQQGNVCHSLHGQGASSPPPPQPAPAGTERVFSCLRPLRPSLPSKDGCEGHRLPLGAILHTLGSLAGQAASNYRRKMQPPPG